MASSGISTEALSGFVNCVGDEWMITKGFVLGMAFIVSPPQLLAASYNSGVQLWNQYCASCHGSVTTTNKRNRSASQIRTALSLPYMSNLSFLSSGELEDLSYALSNDAPAQVSMRLSTSTSGLNANPRILFTTRLSSHRPGIGDSSYVRAGAPDLSQWFEIRNTGSAPLRLQSVGVHSPDVRLDRTIPSSGLSVNAGGSLRVGVIFDPRTPNNSDSGWIDFEDSDGLVIQIEGIAKAFISLTGKSTFRSDIDYDGRVGFTDLTYFAGQFGKSSQSPGFDPTGDMDGNGRMDFQDLTILSQEFGKSLETQVSNPGLGRPEGVIGQSVSGGVVALAWEKPSQPAVYVIEKKINQSWLFVKEVDAFSQSAQVDQLPLIPEHPLRIYQKSGSSQGEKVELTVKEDISSAELFNRSELKLDGTGLNYANFSWRHHPVIDSVQFELKQYSGSYR